MKARKSFLYIAALAVPVFISTAHAQLAYRSSSSAFTSGSGGTPTAPTFRSYSAAILVAGGNATKRLYLTSKTADADPPTLRGNWPDGGATTFTKVQLSRAVAPMTGSSGWTTRAATSANPGRVMVTRFVSDPLTVAQTISGTLNWVVGAVETNAGLNAYWQFHVYVLRGSDTLVGTLLNNYAELSTSGNEFGTTSTGKGPAGGVKANLTPVAAQAGDRIVIEAGYITYATRNDTGRIWYGGQGGSATGIPELTVGSTAAVSNPGWFEFSQDLFGSTIAKPLGTVAGDVMIATISVRPNTATITPPSGWTLVRRVDNTTSPASSLAIYRRTVDATDSSVDNYAFSTSGATSAIGAIRTFSGVDTANPIDVENGATVAAATLCPSPGNQMCFATPDVTTTTANTLLVMTHAVPAGNLLMAPYTTYTSSDNFCPSCGNSGVTGNSSSTTIDGSSVVQATAGATGTKLGGYQPTTTAYPGIAHVLALRGVGGGGSNTLTINAPSGLAQNDVMIASISAGPSTVTITPPSGWTLVRRMDNANGTSNSLAVYTKLAAGNEPTSYSWTLSNGHTGAAGGIMAFMGADPVIEVENGQNTASGTSHATPSISTGLNNTMIITSHGVGASSMTWTPPSGMTESVDANGGSAGLEMNYVLQSAYGPTGIKTATSTATGTGNAHILAVRRVVGAFDAFETTTAAAATSGYIKTKISGTSVTLSIAAVNAAKNTVATTYVGNVAVEVLDASNSSGVLDPNTGCNSSWTLIQTLPDVGFNPSHNGRRNFSFTVDNSYPNVRLRMSSPSGAPDTIACSSDNFAIRPNAFTTVSFTDNDWATAGTTRTLNNLTVPGGMLHKAGKPFTVRATAVNGAGTPVTTTNYTGTITRTDLADCGATNACISSPAGTLSVGAVNFVAGQLTSNVATYDNVGAVAVTLVDANFASVDNADGSTAAEREIKSSPVNVGRFVPDHFAVSYNTPIFGAGCSADPAWQPNTSSPAGSFVRPTTPNGFRYEVTSGGGNSGAAEPTWPTTAGATVTDGAVTRTARPAFTYVGQKFFYSTTPVMTVTAQNASNGTTTDYTGALWQITSSSLTGKSYTAASGSLDTSGIIGTDPVIADSGNGTGTLSFGSGTGLFFTRSSPVAPFNAELSLAINVIDADGVAYASNPARFGQASAGNGIAFGSGKAMRFGRLALKNANGSQLVPLPVQMETQYYGYTNSPTNTVLGFITNRDDTCTSLANNNIQMTFNEPNLTACETAVTAAGTLYNGRKTLLLPAPGNGNNGSVTLSANLNSVASGTTCTSVGGGTVSAAGASETYLQGNWTGSSYTDNPSARATFGTVKGADEVIFVRENF